MAGVKWSGLIGRTARRPRDFVEFLTEGMEMRDLQDGQFRNTTQKRSTTARKRLVCYRKVRNDRLRNSNSVRYVVTACGSQWIFFVEEISLRDV